MEYENRRLRSLLYKSLYTGIDLDDIELYELAPNTVRDLLHEIKVNELKRVKSFRNIGDKTIRGILDALQKAGIFDAYDRCYLFQYV